LPGAFVLTLGCPKNEADSDSFQACLRAAGWELIDDPEDADLLLLNTCAFIQPAVEESMEAIGEALDWKSRKRSRKLVLAGCLPGRFHDDGSGGLSDFDLIIGPADTGGLLDWLGLPPESVPGVYGRRHLRYLKVSEGCSNRCAYCTIPLIRGPRRDRSTGEILRDAAMMVHQGAGEIGLVGQDTGAWSEDGGIHRLVGTLAEEYPDVWFRLYYLHPAHIVPGLAGLMTEHGNVMPYLDVPVQHCSDRILKRMGRGYGRALLEELFTGFDDSVADLAVRTTVIVGYPGETENEFLELMGFLSRHRCIRTVAAFPFWPEEGTTEYFRIRPGELPSPETVQSRLSQVGDAADAHYRDWGERLEDRVLQVMVDSPGTGHTVFDAPLVDGTCFLESDEPEGTVLECRITDYEGPDLTAEVIA